MTISRKFLRMLIEQESSKLHAFHGNKWPAEKMDADGPSFDDDVPVTEEDLDDAANHLINNKDKIDKLIAYSRGAAVLNKLAADPSRSKEIQFPEITYIAPAAKRQWGASGITSPKVKGRVIASAGDNKIPVKQACKIADEAGIPLYIVPGEFKSDNWETEGSKNHIRILKYKNMNTPGRQMKSTGDCATSPDLPDWGETDSASEDELKAQIKILQDKFGFSEKDLKSESKARDKSKKLPFKEAKLVDGRFARLFEADVDDHELGWHRDREDRVVEVIRGGGWSFQADNELPRMMREGDVIEIPALEWHRVIRGTGPLVVAVEKLTLEEAKRRKVRRSYLTGTRKSNKQMRREIDKCAKEPRPASCYKDWTADKTYRKSKKAKRNPYARTEAAQLAEGLLLIEEGIEPIDDVVVEAVLLLAEAKLSEKTRKALKKKAEKANAPLGALTAVYRKGLAAWLTGHRQGVSQHQWAMGRVNSFLRGGKARKVDKTQWAMVQRHRSKK